MNANEPWNSEEARRITDGLDSLQEELGLLDGPPEPPEEPGWNEADELIAAQPTTLEVLHREIAREVLARQGFFEGVRDGWLRLVRATEAGSMPVLRVTAEEMRRRLLAEFERREGGGAT